MKSRFGTLFFENGVAQGAAHYDDEYPSDPKHARVVVWGKLESGISFPMILDTAATWCVLDPELVSDLALGELGLVRSIILRGETYEGRVVRLSMTLRADEGEDFTFEMSVFLPVLYPGETWPHPNFLGLNSALDRMRVTIDPGENVVYFGPAD